MIVKAVYASGRDEVVARGSSIAILSEFSKMIRSMNASKRVC